MKKTYRNSLNALMETFDLGPTVALTMLLVATTILLTGIVFFIRSAPPTELTMTSGPEGSIFHGMAQKYATALQKNGIKVHVLTSHGSVENLKRISDPKAKVDLALAQSGGEDQEEKFENLVSLGGLSFQPIFFFYRGSPIERLSDMKGKTMAVGQEGSAARRLSLKLLKLNGIPESAQLLGLEGDAVSDALLNKKIDGAFMMSEDASVKVLKKLLFSEDIHLLSFKNAAAYVRKIDILHILELPEGVVDFEKNIPEKNVTLMGPMVELIATKDLHPALSDMILDAAMEIHGTAGMFRKRGEFPTATENRIKLSDDAVRFYQSGKTFLYRYLPFWLASLMNRILVVFLPMLLVLIPAVRSIPALFRWLGQIRIRRRYRALLKLEERFKHEVDPEIIKQLNEQFERIEQDVQQMKVRAIFADQFYSLRGHIDYVRRLMASKMGS
jgi:NMT1-like family